MNHPSYEKSIEQLENLHSQMKAVLEWKKLRMEEVYRNPSLKVPSYDTSLRQLVDLKSKFFFNSMRLREALLDKNAASPDAHSRQLINKLTSLEQQVHYLGSNIRFY